jgi:signal peptidase I
MPPLFYAPALPADPASPRLLRTRRRAWKIVNFTVTTLLVASIAAVAYGASQGIRPAVSRSDSMKPHSQAGDLLLSEHVQAASVQPGDIITFLDASRGGDRTTHRLVAKRPVKAGELIVAYEMTTKGDANNVADKPWRINADGIVGREVTVVPHVGRAAHALTTPMGRATVAALILLLLVASWATGGTARGPR